MIVKGLETKRHQSKMPNCNHVWVNVGFSSIKMACKLCGIYQKDAKDECGNSTTTNEVAKPATVSDIKYFANGTQITPDELAKYFNIKNIKGRAVMTPDIDDSDGPNEAGDVFDFGEDFSEEGD